MNKKNSSVGLIGLGYWGKNLARNLNDLGVLSAICDINKNYLEKYKKIYSISQCYNNLEQLLLSNIDAVVIATPAATHGSIVRKALNSGKHVFVEKPLCLDVAEGEELKDLAEEKKLKLMVGHLLLYHPAFIELKKKVQEGKLGKIRYIYSNRLSLGKLRKEEDALWSFAPHDISMILSLVQSEPTKIDAFGGYYLRNDIADTTITLLEFFNGIKAHVYVSWLHPYKDQRLIVVGDKAMAAFVDVEEDNKKLMLYEHSVAWNDNIPIIEKAEGKSIIFDHTKEPLKEECKSYIDWLNNKIIPPSDVSEGLKVLKVLDEAKNQLRKNNNK